VSPKLPVALVLGVCLLLTACEEAEVAAPEERIRAIKYFVVSDRAGSAERRFSGTLDAANSSGLAFAVSGTVATVSVVQGEQVTAGQEIATLDSTPFDLDVDAAQAELSATRARYSEAQSDLDRQQELFEKGWVAIAALEQAQAAFQSAEAELNLARTRLGAEQRDLEKSVLVAPFDGVIAERNVEPFEEVQAGSALFRINSEGALETQFSVPDTVVERLSLGSELAVDVRTVAACGCTAVITEIGSASGSANTVDVTASLIDPVSGLLPGMAVEVIASLSDEGDSGFLVPLSAIAPGDGESRGYVFVFDPEQEIVQRIPVTGGSSISGNLVEIAEGLEAGHIVASAGVSFLQDGQRVRLLEE